MQITRLISSSEETDDLLLYVDLLRYKEMAQTTISGKVNLKHNISNIIFLYFSIYGVDWRRGF